MDSTTLTDASDDNFILTVSKNKGLRLIRVKTAVSTGLDGSHTTAQYKTAVSPASPVQSKTNRNTV